MAHNLIRDVSIERETMRKTREGPNAIKAGTGGADAAGCRKKKSPSRKSQLEKKGTKKQGASRAMQRRMGGGGSVPLTRFQH